MTYNPCCTTGCCYYPNNHTIPTPKPTTPIITRPTSTPPSPTMSTITDASTTNSTTTTNSNTTTSSKTTTAIKTRSRPPVDRSFIRVSNQKISLLARYQQKLLILTNRERRKYGAGPVTLHPHLMEAAAIQNSDVAFQQERLSHIGSDGSRMGERVLRTGYIYKYASENLARGQGSCEHVIRSWMLSPGHRKNLLNNYAVHMGVHVGRGRNGQLYWAQVFGHPMRRRYPF